jgi:hypothetical protein
MISIRNTSTSLQTTLAAEAHLAEKQFVSEDQAVNLGKSLMYIIMIMIKNGTIFYIYKAKK